VALDKLPPDLHPAVCVIGVAHAQVAAERRAFVAEMRTQVLAQTPNVIRMNMIDESFAIIAETAIVIAKQGVETGTIEHLAVADVPVPHTVATTLEGKLPARLGSIGTGCQP